MYLGRRTMINEICRVCIRKMPIESKIHGSIRLGATFTDPLPCSFLILYFPHDSTQHIIILTSFTTLHSTSSNFPRTVLHSPYVLSWHQCIRFSPPKSIHIFSMFEPKYRPFCFWYTSYRSLSSSEYVHVSRHYVISTSLGLPLPKIT